MKNFTPVGIAKNVTTKVCKYCMLKFFTYLCSEEITATPVAKISIMALSLVRVPANRAHPKQASANVNNNTPIQNYVHPDDQIQPTFQMTSGFKPFTINN